MPSQTRGSWGALGEGRCSCWGDRARECACTEAFKGNTRSCMRVHVCASARLCVCAPECACTNMLPKYQDDGASPREAVKVRPLTNPRPKLGGRNSRELARGGHSGLRPKMKGRNYCCCLAKSLQSCPTLCDPIDGSPPGSPVPGILQARTLEWVAISFSNA